MTDTEKAIEAYKKKKHRESSYQYYIEHRKSQREFDTRQKKPKSKLYMTEREIILSYKQAARPQKQIKILAELNDVSIEAIEDILNIKRKKAKRNVCVR